MSSSCSSGSIAYRSYDDSDTEGEAVNNSDSDKNEAQQEAIPSETGNDMVALSQPKAQEIGNEEAAIEGVDEVTQASRGAPRKRNRKVESEVDRYLLDPIECPPNVEAHIWDLLKWWKLNGYKYPNIALVAKDILAIQVSTVASESSFSTGGRVIDPFRSSLSPKTVEALICLQNWIAKKNQSEIEFYPSQEEIEFYEKMEKDAAKQKAKKKAEKGKGKQQILVESEDEAPVEIVAAKPTKRMKGNTSGKANSVGPVAVPSAPIVNDVATSQREPPRVMKMMFASKKSKGRR